ncbi:MAG TPA: bacteriohemerythrin [Bryobacteraceae bacterium]|nr:bacteriohemerythrin [Bryobacteraceae bacterium]
MGLFQWNDGYSVGHAEIDRQHKRWFQLAHELHSAVVTGKGKEVLSQTLANFVAYTKGHFASEERLMLTHGYPDYSEHRDQHEALTQKVVQFHKEFEAGRATVTMELLQFLKVWLGHHISIVDCRVGAFLKQKGS